MWGNARDERAGGERNFFPSPPAPTAVLSVAATLHDNCFSPGESLPFSKLTQAPVTCFLPPPISVLREVMTSSGAILGILNFACKFPQLYPNFPKESFCYSLSRCHHAFCFLGPLTIQWWLLQSGMDCQGEIEHLPGRVRASHCGFIILIEVLRIPRISSIPVQVSTKINPRTKVKYSYELFIFLVPSWEVNYVLDGFNLFLTQILNFKENRNLFLGAITPHF